MSKVAIIGYGNVGYHFARTVSKKHEVIIYTRTPQADESFAIDEFDPEDFDIALLTVPDDAVKNIAADIELSECLIIHTSGTRPLTDLEQHARRGVIYPLQTMSKEKELNFNSFPIFIEGTDETEKELFSFVRTFATDVRLSTSYSRAKLHLAAVFACNFTNHMYFVAEQILSSMEMSFEELQHLAKETFENATALSPQKAQTGPAIRKDEDTMKKHVDMLDNPNWKKIYELISSDIRSSQG